MRLSFVPLLLAALFFAAGCGRGVTMTGTEQADSDFIRAQDLKKRGLQHEALTAFRAVIARRGENAPESHLEAGLIYYEHLKDPRRALSHLEQYLELQPNSPRRDSVRQTAMAAERDWSSQRMRQSQFGGGELVQLQEQVEQLTRENAQLKAELRAVREAPSGVVTRTEIPFAPPAAQIQLPGGAAAAAGQITLAQPAAAPAITLNPTVAPKTNAAAGPKAAATPKGGTPAAKTAAAPARMHVVRPNDTLVKIARLYYDGDVSAARLNALRDANRDVLQGKDALAIGMNLRIP